MNILLIVDMQRDFIDGSLGTEEAQTILPYVVDKVKTSKSDLILFTKDTHGENYLDTQEGRRLPVEHCIEGTQGWEIHPELLLAWQENKDTRRLDGLSSNTVTKNTFGSSGLIRLLEGLAETEEIRRVEIMGLCTDICVISNALLLKAFFPEAFIQVDQSGCAGVTPEGHLTAINAMIACQIDMI